jgi:hypothetical protein
MPPLDYGAPRDHHADDRKQLGRGSGVRWIVRPDLPAQSHRLATSIVTEVIRPVVMMYVRY